MKAIVLAIVLAVSGSIGFAGVASAQAGPPSDAQGYWQWIIDHSVPETPSEHCCATAPSTQPCPVGARPARTLRAAPSFICPPPPPVP